MGAPTAQWKVYTGASGATESPATSATNINFQSIDAYDSTGTDYQTNLIRIPAAGTTYSYERIIRMKFTANPSFNLINNILFWKSAGSLSDVALAIKAGTSTGATTPVDTASAVATAAVPTTEGTALDPTPSGGISSSPGYSKYVYLQLNVPSTVTVFGDIGAQTFTMQYDVS